VSPRVLILSTPFGARTHLDGSRLAVADLVAGLVATGVAEPRVLCTDGHAPPEGARSLAIGEGGLVRALEVVAATALADVDVIHAWFTPRVATGVVLRAMRTMRRVRVVQTVASVPKTFRGLELALPGDVVVPTSDATAIALATSGFDATRLTRVPAPFAQAGEVAKDPAIPRDLLLFAGDLEFDDGLERTLSAFAKMAPPRGVSPHLAVASRRKTERAEEVETKAKKRVEETPSLRGRVSFIGERPSLLPWIAAARAVIVPARTTYAKLDHPRVLLEAIALGVRVIVGAAPSLAELVDDPRIGEVAKDPRQLREAFENAFTLPPPPANAILRVLAIRRPEAVATRYAPLYMRA
jgi:glycosyltransferase involved in cell wall biosynthesis